jgi:hypothetical protein
MAEVGTVQTNIGLPRDVREACERRAAAERRSLSGYLRNVIADSVASDGDAVASTARAR